jgi:hypothetical protein
MDWSKCSAELKVSHVGHNLSLYMDLDVPLQNPAARLPSSGRELRHIAHFIK